MAKRLTRPSHQCSSRAARAVLPSKQTGPPLSAERDGRRNDCKSHHDEQWYQGTADAVYQNIYTLEKERPSHVVILAGDHIYKMDYSKMIAFHEKNNADLTIAAFRWEARLLRTRAFVAAMLPTGRRARGASVPPRPSSFLEGEAPSIRH